MNAIEQIQAEIKREMADSYFSGLKRMNAAIDALRQSTDPAEHPRLLREATRMVQEIIIQRECIGWGVAYHAQFYVDYDVPLEIQKKMGNMIVMSD